MKEHSRFLSLVLRHRPEAAGIVLDEGGWIDVDTLLRGLASVGRPLTRDQLQRLVRESDKQRFAFSSDGRRIRANQGHSVPVELGLPSARPPSILYHGTVERSLSSILEQGLRPGQRHHVHLSADRTTAIKVGSRKGKPIVLQVNSAAMVAEGHVFYVSDNGVWLTDRVPPAYIERLADQGDSWG